MIHLRTGSRTEELFSKFWISFLLLLLLFPHSNSKPEDFAFREKVVVEDFEAGDYSVSNLKSRVDPALLPEIAISSLFIAPVPGSKKSLFIRFRDYNDSLVKLLFNREFVVSDYAEEIFFNIYSSGFDASLALLIKTFNGDIVEHKITTMNFTGWREIRFPVRNLLNQNDYLLFQAKSFSISGIVIKQGRYIPGRENSMALDDIFLVKRKKLLIRDDLKTFK